jgi:hypothetical protein
MSGPSSLYRKVSGGGFSWKGYGGLWLAEDHLLEVSSVVVTETYRRFFFQDARAFVVRHTKVRVIWSWILGGLGAGLGLLSLLSWWIAAINFDQDWHVALYFPMAIFGVGAVVFLTLWGINLALGPTCRCHLLTATGWHALSAPTRLGRAARAQSQIASVIEASQGAVPSPGSASA